MNIILDETFKNYPKPKDKKIDIKYCNPNNIINYITKNNFDAFILTHKYRDILYDIRNIGWHHRAFIATFDECNNFCPCSDYLFSEDISEKTFLHAFNSLVDSLKPNPRAKIFNHIKTLLVSADNDLKTQLYRVPIITKFIIDKLIEDELYDLKPNTKFVNETIYFSAIHDFGKIAIEDEILDFTGRFSKEQMDKMKMHTTLGLQLYKNFSDAFPEIKSNYANNIIYYHHERYDSKGYPNGIGGNNIPLEARIVAAADVYDALRSRRKYKNSMNHNDSFNILKEGSGTQFDPMIIATLKRHEKDLEELYNRLI